MPASLERERVKAETPVSNPRRLPRPVVLSSKSGATYLLVASDAHVAHLQIAPGTAVPTPGEPLELASPAGDFVTVGFELEAQELVEEGGQPTLVARWLRLTARQRRRDLADAAKRLLGLDAWVEMDGELGPHRMLEYDVATGWVRLVEVPARAFIDANGVRRPGRRAPKKAGNTQVGLVIQGRDTGKQPAADMPKGLPTTPYYRPTKIPTPPRVKTESDPKLSVAEQRRRALRPSDKQRELGPLYRRTAAMGFIGYRAYVVSLYCCWVGPDRVVFVGQDVSPPPVGQMTQVGVPGDPVVDGLLTIRGTISRVREMSSRPGSILVEVDISATTLPKAYRRMVAHWQEAD